MDQACKCGKFDAAHFASDHDVCTCGHIRRAHRSKFTGEETSCRACGLQGFTCVFRFSYSPRPEDR